MQLTPGYTFVVKANEDYFKNTKNSIITTLKSFTESPN